MKPAQFLAIASLAAALLAPLAAHAGRPLVTEDAGVADPGECEIETWAARQRSRGAGKLDGGYFEPACGVELPFPTQIGAAFATERDPDGRRIALGLNGKTALRELSDEDWGFAIAWSLGRARAPGEGWRADESSVIAVLSVPVQRDLLVHANLG